MYLVFFVILIFIQGTDESLILHEYENEPRAVSCLLLPSIPGLDIIPVYDQSGQDMLMTGTVDNLIGQIPADKEPKLILLFYTDRLK